MRRIEGFDGGDHSWHGTTAVILKHVDDHTETVKYSADFGSERFDAYVPRAALLDEATAPQSIGVALASSLELLRRGTFLLQPFTPAAFHLVLRDKPNYPRPRYEGEVNGRRFDFYVPAELFEGDKNPSDLFFVAGAASGPSS